MLLIVANHYTLHSGLLTKAYEQPFAENSIFLYILGIWGKIGINCFVLITGYFMCKSSITLHKFLKLFLEIWFYNLVIYFTAVAFNLYPFSFKWFICTSPVWNIHVNFVGCFIVFYLFIPFLNILIHGMNEKQHRLLIFLCLGLYTGLGFIAHVTMNYVTWFCILYLIASYIRLYGLFPRLTHMQWGWLALGSIFASILSVFILLSLHLNYFKFVMDSNAPLAVTTAICLFMFFKDLKIPQSKFINTLGGSTFAVLLIHDNWSTGRSTVNWLWKDTLNCLEWYNSNYLWLHAIICVLGVFIICIIIDRIRITLIEKPLFIWIDKILASKGWR